MNDDYDDAEKISFEVQVTSIENINNFHVRKESEERTIDQIQSILNRDSSCELSEKSNVQFMNVGDNVAASYEADNLFYRAKILCRFEEENSGCQFEVLFIDFGNKAVVSSNSVRPLSRSLLAIPPLAIKCSMFDCVPHGAASTLEFGKLVTSSWLLMEVMGKEDDTLLVDLIMEMDDNIKYTSIRDLLVFSGQAEFNIDPCSIIPNIEERWFKKLPILPTGSTQLVAISHVHKQAPCQGDLLQLSVHLLSDPLNCCLQLPYLMDQMKSVYRAKRSEELWGVVQCWPGMVCAVKDPEDKLWYRAEVVKILKARIIMVKYVDFGNCVTVSAHRIRRLFSDFMDLPALAIRVCMRVRVPSIEIMDAFKENFLMRDVRMHVVEQGSENVLPTIDLDLDGISVSEWFKLITEDQVPQ